MTHSHDLGLHMGAHGASTSAEAVFGRDVAEQGLISALIRHGRAREILLAYSVNPFDSPPEAPAEWLAAAMAARPACKVETVTVHDLKDRSRSLDVGVWHDADSELAQAAALRARFSRRSHPLTATMHVASYAGTLEHWLLPMMLQRLRPYDALICTSHAVRGALRVLIEAVDERLDQRMGARLGWSAQLPVIPLGVDTDVFCPRDRREARLRLSLPVDARIVLWLGRISAADKGDLAPLLTACRPLLSQEANRDVCLVVAGSGRQVEVERIQAHAAALQIAERVRLIAAPPELRHLVMAAADVFVSPADSMQETFGLTPIEAMACGVPQVVADWDGYRETVVEGETGFRVPTYVADLEGEVERTADLFGEWGLCDHLVWGQSTVVDVDVLAARLELLLSHEELRRTLGERSRRRAVSHFAWPVVVDRYEQLWSELRGMAAAAGAPSPDDDFGAVPSFAAFAGYASRRLEAEELLEADHAARAAVADPSAMLALLPPKQLLDREILATLLRHEWAEAGAFTLGAAEAHCAAALGRAAPVVRRHVLWLLKQGYFRLARPRTPR